MRLTINLLALLIVCMGYAQEKLTDANINELVAKKIEYCNKVYGSYKSEKVILLNLGAEYPNAELTIAIFKSDWKKFDYSPEEFLKEKEICVTGKLILYKDQPEIIVKTPSQITIKE